MTGICESEHDVGEEETSDLGCADCSEALSIKCAVVIPEFGKRQASDNTKSWIHKGRIRIVIPG
jgi:hypothetical protein